MTGTPLLRICRPPWQRLPGDRWRCVASTAEARDALGAAPRCVFLTLGRRDVGLFEAAAHHIYLVRSVDALDPLPDLPQAHFIMARGPFSFAEEMELMRNYGIDCVVSKNSGG